MLGRTQLNISDIGFGAWALGGSWGEQKDSDSISALHRAIDLGVNFIDTAAVYGEGKSERLIARVLKERSEEVYVATKTPPAPSHWPPSPYCDVEDRFSEKYLRNNIEERLRNLDTDCIDILQLHTWTRAWNKNPRPFDLLKTLQNEGKIRYIGISTPEHDQNSVIDLMRGGYLDTVQVIYNIFEQEPAAELLPVALESNVGIIVRVPFDEGMLTGKYSKETVFKPGDFRHNYFSGNRLIRSVNRVERIKEDVADNNLTLPQIALKFALQHPAVSTVIPGIRDIKQADANIGVSDLPDLSDRLHDILKEHMWNRAFWYSG